MSALLVPRLALMKNLSCIALLLIFVFASGSFAQTPKSTPRSEDQEIRIESRLIVIPVSVTDAAGNPVTNLGKNDFTVIEEGKRQEVDNVGNADVVPLEIALLFDVSGSTDAMFRFQQETAAKFLNDVMKPIDRATIFTIGMKPILVTGREEASKAVVSVRNVTPTKGATAFFDTVREAADFLRINAPQGSRRVLVVISDGEDNYSIGVQRAQRSAERQVADNRPDPEYKRLNEQIKQAQNTAKNSERARVLKALQDADVVHYSINPAGSSFLLNQISVFGQENMQRFSAETGGTAFLPKFLPIDTKDLHANSGNMKRNATTLETIFRQLANELRAQYLIQYYSDSEFPEGRFVRLNVALKTPATNKLRSRQGYYVKN